ncbi:MAG: hypothetical protein ISS49_04030 [Anaerolineae bacterium]|nr:hypothetical protein [Anaerolineae bacterium]
MHRTFHFLPLTRSRKNEREHSSKSDRTEEQLADLKARLPKHSVPPAMLIELEELEEELERTRAEAAQESPQ